MRITDNMRFTSLTLDRNRSAEQLATATQRASSGLAVSMPSDGPTAYVAAAALDGAAARLTSRNEIVSRAGGDLDLAETTVASASDVLVQAREIAVDMANGDKNGNDRATAAEQIDGLRSQLLALANTRGTGGYLFGGTATATPPFNAAGAFTANDSVVGVEIADKVVVASNASGAMAFTAKGGRDVLQDLADLSAALTANNPNGVQATLTGLDASHQQIVTARASAGISANRFQSASSVATAALITLAKARSGAVDADPTAAYSDLARAKTSYEQNIAVTAQLLSLPTLAR